MLESNKTILDKLNKSERLKPRIYVVLSCLFIVVFVYSIYRLGLQYDKEIINFTKTSVVGKIKGIAANKSSTFCSYELKSGEIIVLHCPDKHFNIGDEVNLQKVTKPSGYEYYLVESELAKKLNALTHHSDRKSLPQSR